MFEKNLSPGEWEKRRNEEKKKRKIGKETRRSEVKEKERNSDQ
jgi:hypothetical protein